jgi:hypothetical protein
VNLSATTLMARDMDRTTQATPTRRCYTQRSRVVGRSMQEVVERLRPCLLGWKAYFGLARTPGFWRELDEGLRAIQLKQ